MARTSKAIAISELFEQISRRILGASRGQELNRLQWSALRYYACVRKKARTIEGFATAHAISRGRAIQIVRQLRRKHLLSCRSGAITEAEDIRVTEAATRLLRRDPQLLIRAALTGLSASERRALLISLRRACVALARSTKQATHLILAAAASLVGYGPDDGQRAQNALAQSASDLLSRLA